MLDLTNRILNTAGLTGGAQCSAASQRKDGDGGVSSLLLVVDFRGGPVWHLREFCDFIPFHSMGGPVHVL